MSRVFVLGLRVWQQAGIKAQNRLTNRKSKNRKRDRTRIDRATRLLRKRVISRVGKAMECKGRGDLQDPEVLKYMRYKHTV